MGKIYHGEHVQHIHGEDLFYLLFLACCCNKLLDVFFGSSVAPIVATLCVWLLVAARRPWPHYADPRRKRFTWRKSVSVFSLLVLRTTLILNLVQILAFRCPMAINTMILNTLIFALGLCGVRLSRARGGDIVSGTCSTTTGGHGAQPQLDEEKSLGVDSGYSCSSQGLERQVRRTADVPRPDLRYSAPACAAAFSCPPCKNNASESAVPCHVTGHSLATCFEPDVLYIKKTASAEIIGQDSVDGSGLYVLDYLHLTGTRTGSHPHLDAEAEPCGIDDSGHSSSQSTGTAQQAMPAYACSTKDEDQMPVALIASSSIRAGGHPEIFVDSGASCHITGYDLENLEPMTGAAFGISGPPLLITGQGSVMGTPPICPIWLDNVRYAPGLPKLLVSVSQLTRERSVRVIFEPYSCRVERMSDNCTIGQGPMVGDLYTLEFLFPG